MNKKQQQKETLKKSFKAVLNEFDRQKDKHIRKLSAELLDDVFKKVKLKLRDKRDSACEKPINASEDQSDNPASELKPSPGIVEEIRGSITSG